MSLRGSETTEAISQGTENREIATLPPVARNDKKGIMTQSLRKEGMGEFERDRFQGYLLSNWLTVCSKLVKMNLFF
jgi:hypothetical protein